jgi:hypothetical protein
VKYFEHRSGIVVNHFQLLRIDSVTRVQAVISPARPPDSAHVRRVEAAFPKFHSGMVGLKYNHLPCQNTIIHLPAIMPGSAVRLELREHLKVTPDAGRLDLVPLQLSDSLARLLIFQGLS